MPRDSQGNFTLPSGTLVSTGDTILVSQHNPALQDLEQSMSNSLDRNGSGGMRANLSMGNNRITGLLPGVEQTDAATVGQVGGVPFGVVVDFWGTAPPQGFMFAAGQEVSRSTYADLFAVIGTSAGGGNGSTTFNLPDYRGRVGAGRESMIIPTTTRLNTLSSSTLGATGGAQTHTLTEAELAPHKHDVVDPGHTHGVQGHFNTSFDSGPSSLPLGYPQSEVTGSSTTGITVEGGGGGEAHNNVQPTIICNKIMRVL